jgi:hypothetical protein
MTDPLQLPAALDRCPRLVGREFAGTRGRSAASFRQAAIPLHQNGGCHLCPHRPQRSRHWISRAWCGRLRRSGLVIVRGKGDRPSPEKYLTPVAAPPPATCSMGFEALRWARGILESVASAALISINAGRRRRLSAFDGRDHDAAMMSFASRHSPRLPQLTLRRRARCDRSPAHRRALRSRVLLDACRRGATAE